MALKTDYKDDVLDGLRKYRMVNNSDGTVSFVDVTMYDQEGDDYGANDINSTNEAVNKIGANLATIENTTTASKAYTVGDFLVYDGVLYKVTQAISSGGTISIGTNVEADKVGDEIARINSDLTELIQVNSGTTLSTLISAINALSDKEFFYSKLFLNNTEVLNPDNISSAVGREYSRWATAGTATQMQYGISRVDSGTSRCYVVQKATNGSYTAIDVTVTNWKLYYIKDLSI